MAWRRAVLTLSATALALGACSKPAEKPAAGAPPAAVSPAAAKAPAAGPAGMPARRPGLWEHKVTSGGRQQVSRICLDKAVESKMAVWGAQAGQDTCQQTSMTPIAGGWRFSSACDLGAAGKTATQGTVTGDFNSHYQVEAATTFEGGGAPKGAHTMMMEATWQGPCPADMKPGDMAMPNGMKINMMDMAARRPPRPARP
jgi:hypothetical protein